ncbi:GAF domain-containing protein [Pseudonocardia sp. T1-2H]|uniref:GAF domain-containing protein n=1 Tax=Pseudonocardia sp. T1-2H TaxID=3128899 RepID=UPI0031012D5E
MTLTTIRTSTPAEVLDALLALLAEDAPAAEIAARAAELVDGADPRRRDLLARAAADAVRIRNLLDRREQREREAQALYETARDLTSLRGTDEVLRAIVDRVRRLLGSDSAYIALVDEATGDAFMRVTSGTRSSAIRSVRQRPGYGVGGYVIATGQPMATSNYRADPAIRHDPSVAAAVGADAIVSIVGVPMKAGGTVIGALFAADRTERTFDQAEIALLTSLAAHASVIIENARLYERLQSDTDDLRRAGARLATQRHALERAAFAHEQLMPLVLHRADVGEFARTLTRILGGTTVVLDESGRALAEARAPGSPEVADLRTVPLPPGARALPVRAGEETFGWLLFARGLTLTEADERTLERSAQTAALLLLMDRQTTIVEQELRAELLADLLAERAPDWAALQRRAERSGAVDFDRPHTAVVASAGDTSRRTVLTAAAELAERHGGIAGEHGGTVVLLLPEIDAAAAARLVPDDSAARWGRRSPPARPARPRAPAGSAPCTAGPPGATGCCWPWAGPGTARRCRSLGCSGWYWRARPRTRCTGCSTARSDRCCATTGRTTRPSRRPWSATSPRGRTRRRQRESSGCTSTPSTRGWTGSTPCSAAGPGANLRARWRCRSSCNCTKSSRNRHRNRRPRGPGARRSRPVTGSQLPSNAASPSTAHAEPSTQVEKRAGTRGCTGRDTGDAGHVGGDDQAGHQYRCRDGAKETL